MRAMGMRTARCAEVLRCAACAAGNCRLLQGEATGRRAYLQLYGMTTLSNSSAGIPPLNSRMPPRFADGHRIAPNRTEHNQNMTVFHNLEDTATAVTRQS